MAKYFLLLCLFCTAAFAQKVDLALLGGGQVSVNRNGGLGTGAVIQGNAGYRILKAPLVALYAEIPITASFAINRRTSFAIGSGDYNTLFITPGLRLKLAPISPVSPFFTLGAGFARYGAEAGLFSNTTNVVQFGGGVDYKIAPFVGLRTEVRDYFTGAPRFDSTFIDRQHNITFMGGIVLRF
jgi:Outer membrane protein beta-barrel domain